MRLFCFSLLLFAHTFLLGQDTIPCDYSISIIDAGIGAYTNGQWVFEPFCEDNYVGFQRVDFLLEVCRTPPLNCTESINIWFNGGYQWPVSFPIQDDTCRTIWISNRPYFQNYEICLSPLAGANYSPLIDLDQTNNCAEISIDLIYCENGCIGDECADDLPIYSNNGYEYPSFLSLDNSQCWDEIDNEQINEGECAISVENNNFFIYSVNGSEPFCIDIVGLPLDNPDDELQIVVWDVSAWPWDGDCTVTQSPPILSGCDFTFDGNSQFQNLSIDTILQDAPAVYLVMIDGNAGDGLLYTAEFCGEIILLAQEPPVINPPTTPPLDNTKYVPKLLYITDLRLRRVFLPPINQPYFEFYDDGTVKRKCQLR